MVFAWLKKCLFSAVIKLLPAISVILNTGTLPVIYFSVSYENRAKARWADDNVSSE